MSDQTATHQATNVANLADDAARVARHSSKAPRAKAKATTAKVTRKAKAATAPARAVRASRLDPTLCRGGQGRYLSAKSSPACTKPRHPKRQLCDEHEQAYRAARKAAAAKASPAVKRAPRAPAKHADPTRTKRPPAPERLARRAVPTAVQAQMAALVAPKTTASE